MSSLITSKEEIKKIYEGLEILRSRGYTVKAIEEVLEKIVIQNDKFLIDFHVSESDELFTDPACFIPSEKVIKVSTNLLSNYINCQLGRINFEGTDVEKLRQELFLWMILYVMIHENEHVKQFLIGQELIDCPYKTVVNLYKNMFIFNENNKEYENEDLKKIGEDLEEIKRILFYLSNHRHSYKFFLERNANVVADDAMLKLCEYEKDMTFGVFYNHQKSCEIANGYGYIWNGPAERSYHKLLLGKLFKELLVDEEIPTEDRVCYGLPVDIKTRMRVMRKKYEL